jgi:hypothetical protein
LRLPRYLPVAFFLLFALTACSLDNKDNKSATAPPPPTAKQETIAPIPTAMDTFRALAPPDGLKFTPLFNENISDTNARIKRLEDAVQTIRNDIDTLVPTMVRMVAIEKDIKRLVAQLQTLTDQNQPQGSAPFAPAGTPSKLPPSLPKQSGSGSATPIPGEDDVAQGTEPAKADEAKAGPVASSLLVTPEAASKGELPPEDAASPNSKAPAEVKLKGLDLSPKMEQSAPVKERSPETEAAPPPAEKPVVGNVVNMRIADSTDKTQLTLDVTAEAPAPVKLINKGKTLVIDLAQFKWLGASTWESDHKKLIEGGIVKGGKLYVNLKRASDFKAEKILAPSDDEKNYRLIIDLFNKKAQKAAATKAIAPAASAPVTTAPAAVPAPKAPEEDFP